MLIVTYTAIPAAFVRGGRTWKYLSTWKGLDPSSGNDLGSAWVPNEVLCDLGDGQITRMGVPVEERLRAYVYPVTLGIVEEKLVICPKWQIEWQQYEDSRAALGFPIMSQHVAIGSALGNPATFALLFTPNVDIGLMTRSWTSTFIHEITHAEAFVGRGNDLSK